MSKQPVLEIECRVLPPELGNVLDGIRWASSEFRRAGVFFGHGTDNDWDEATLLVLWVISQPWERLEQLWSAKLSLAEREKFSLAVSRRIIERCPASYITGEAWFAGFKFFVNEHVLVPRSPIGELIEKQFQPWLLEYPQRILDLCTGSGCIGLASALVFQGAEVDLIDISKDALEVARKNVADYELEERVRVIESDGLSALTTEKYDLIVSNPPYVSEAEYQSLPAEFKVEPKLGLTSGEDGFDFVRSLLQDAEHYLNDDGLLIVEVGHGWEWLQERVPEYPYLWPAFGNGGCGVFILSKAQLAETNEHHNN